MAEPEQVGVLEFLGDIAYGDLGRSPRSVVRLIALEAALWDDLAAPGGPRVITREVGVEVSMGRPLHRNLGSPAGAARSSLGKRSTAQRPDELPV